MRVASGIVERGVEVGDHEHVGDEEDDAKGAIEEVRAEHGAGDCFAGVLDLFRHVRCSVGA